MKVKRYGMIGVLSVGLILAGCQSQSHNTPTPELVKASNYDQIVSRQWTLESMTTDGQAYPLIKKRPSMHFAAGHKITGMASINTFTGSFELTPDGFIRWPRPMMMTRMAGPPQMMKQENAFIKTLHKTEQISVDGDRLSLFSQDRTMELIFKASEQE